MDLLTRRRAMMRRKDSPVTPYQRVEYLESSGTQYIDTGISPPQLGDRFLYHIEIMWQTRSNRQLMGAQNINFWGLNSSGKYESYNATVYKGSTTSFDVVEFVMVKASGKTYRRFSYINQALSTTSTSSTTAFSTNNICFFGILDTTGQELDTRYPCSCKIRSFKIFNDQTGDVYYDAVPVRVGQVVYMYDRVSGQLFGNAGTGDFTIGPDV